MADAGASEPSPAAMKTVLETIQGGADYLARHGIEQPRLNMEHLVARVLGCSRMQLYVDFDRPLGEGELAPLRELLKRRRRREPLQHLLGEVEFFGRRFGCDGRALVPRPETEELVERMLERLRATGTTGGVGPGGRRLLDLGCGSGVIGLTLAAELGSAFLSSVVLADLSPDALQLARENADRLWPSDSSGEERADPGGSTAGSGAPELEFVETDLFAGLGGRRFDVVAANLPYVSSEEMATLAPEVRRDPALALDGGLRGTVVMQAFLARVGGHLAPGGWLAMEIGTGQGAELAAAAEAAGLRDARCEDDLSGNERFLFARSAGSASD